MPHCPYRLYCNVLWSHWHTLDDVCILGNSFESYSLRRIHINPSSKVDANMSKNQMNKKSKQSKKKGSSEEVVEGMHTEAVVEDRTDLVMQLLPFIRERKMWPLSAILSGNHSVEASTVQRREADKEHHHCLEGAFSELR